MNVWRVQTKIGGIDDISEYCIKNNVIALGWGYHEEYLKYGKKISTFGEYVKFVESLGDKVNKNVERLATQVQKGDLVWLRHNGRYYLGRISEKSSWFYNSNFSEIANADANNQISNVEWHLVSEHADECSVPGVVATSFIRGMTFQRIHKNGINEVSKYTYNQIVPNTYSLEKIEFCAENFYNLLSPEECEDLVYFYLYHKYGLICVPSTNKLSTPFYECVLIDPKNGQQNYIQVKKGTVDINATEYSELVGNVWLFTTEGKILEIDKVNNNIKELSPQKVFNFAISKEAENILSEGIKEVINFLKNVSSAIANK